ncbi:hypothetical protein ABZ848_11435 [Streptomyces sp. NPDC047081]
MTARARAESEVGKGVRLVLGYAHQSAARIHAGAQLMAGATAV